MWIYGRETFSPWQDNLLGAFFFRNSQNVTLCTLCLMFSVMALWPCVWICLHESTRARVQWVDICFAAETWPGSTWGEDSFDRTLTRWVDSNLPSLTKSFTMKDYKECSDFFFFFFLTFLYVGSKGKMYYHVGETYLFLYNLYNLSWKTSKIFCDFYLKVKIINCFSV